MAESLRPEHFFGEEPPHRQAEAPLSAEDREPLPKIADYRHDYKGFHGCDCHCRVRVFARGDETPVVVLTELDDNPGTSVTNMVEVLAAEVLTKKLPQRFGYEEPAIVIEHYQERVDHKRKAYGRPDYDQVTFASWTPKAKWVYGRRQVSLPQPHWIPMEPQAVAKLIGEEETEGLRYPPQYRERRRHELP